MRVLVPVESQQMSGAQFLHRDLVRSPTHAGHLLNQRVPGRAGVGPHRAGSRPQTDHAWGLPVKLTWGGLQLRVIPASKHAHTVSTGQWAIGHMQIGPWAVRPCLRGLCYITGQTDIARTAGILMGTFLSPSSISQRAASLSLWALPCTLGLKLGSPVADSQLFLHCLSGGREAAPGQS